MAQNLEMTPDIARIVGAIAHILSCAEHYHRKATQYDVVKALFLADRSHMNEWGRPITYDNYYAMKHGPVPSTAYDILKGTGKSLRGFGLDDVPWSKSDTGTAAYEYRLEEPADEFLAHLSESDREALEAACGAVLKLGFKEVRRLTHQDPGYEAAWPEGAESGSYKMDLALMFEDPDTDAAEDLAGYSPYVQAG